MFECEHESVIPDILVLGKGLTDRYLPLAITLVWEKIFLAFDGSVAEGRALAYGHSHTGNALAVDALRVSITNVCRRSNAAKSKNAEKVTA